MRVILPGECPLCPKCNGTTPGCSCDYVLVLIFNTPRVDPVSEPFTIGTGDDDGSLPSPTITFSDDLSNACGSRAYIFGGSRSLCSAIYTSLVATYGASCVTLNPTITSGDASIFANSLNGCNGRSQFIFTTSTAVMADVAYKVYRTCAAGDRCRFVSEGDVHAIAVASSGAICFDNDCCSCLRPCLLTVTPPANIRMTFVNVLNMAGLLGYDYGTGLYTGVDFDGFFLIRTRDNPTSCGPDYSYPWHAGDDAGQLIWDFVIPRIGVDPLSGSVIHFRLRSIVLGSSPGTSVSGFHYRCCTVFGLPGNKNAWNFGAVGGGTFVQDIFGPTGFGDPTTGCEFPFDNGSDLQCDGAVPATTAGYWNWTITGFSCDPFFVEITYTSVPAVGCDIDGTGFDGTTYSFKIVVTEEP